MGYGPLRLPQRVGEGDVLDGLGHVTSRGDMSRPGAGVPHLLELPLG